MKTNKAFLKKIFILLVSSLIHTNIFAENISFSANSMTGTVGNNSDTTELLGNAYVLTETMEISANSIKMSGKDFRYIEAQGSVKGKNLQSKMEFSCDKLKYDRETKIAELKDNVSLTDTQNDVSAKAQMIEYHLCFAVSPQARAGRAECKRSVEAIDRDTRRRLGGKAR